MNLLIWGSSPFAAYLAARLHPHHAVTWVADAATQGDAQAFGGIRIGDTLTSGITITTTYPTDHIPELILLASPAWATAEFIMQLRQATRWDQNPPPIVVLQNGYGSVQRIESVFGKGHTLAAAMTRPFWYGSYHGGSPNRAHILTADWGGIALQADHPKSEAAAALLHLAGLEVRSGWAESIQWSSVFWGIQANAISSILDITPQAVYQNPQWFAYEHAQLKEALRVIRALKIDLMPLPGVNIPRLAQMVDVVPYKLASPLLSIFLRPPSLRDDLRWQTGHSDAAYFNGAVAVYGNNLRLRTPINHALALVITDLAEGRARWDRYRQKPELLESSLRIAMV